MIKCCYNSLIDKINTLYSYIDVFSWIRDNEDKLTGLSQDKIDLLKENEELKRELEAARNTLRILFIANESQEEV